MEFLLAYERYGIESVYVQEMLQIRELTRLPGTPPFVLGIINIRGTIHSVIDLKKIFSLPDGGLPEFSRVLVIRDKGMAFGIIVDAVAGTRRVLRDTLRPPPPTFSGIRTDYLKGVTPGPVIVLDGGKILADRNLIVQEQA